MIESAPPGQAPTEQAQQTEQVASPGSLIITFAGLYLRQIGGWLPVANLITCLGQAGVSSTAVRQAVVRLKSRGLLTAQKRDGTAGYALTDAGRADLAVGDERIYRFGQAEESQGWVIAVFSVPEQDRAHRHRLRTQLAWLGFGTVAAGVWVAPAALAERARTWMIEQDLDRYVQWFTGQPIGPADVARWWDLDDLQERYSGFVRQWESALDTCNGAGVFAAHLHLLDSWRLFPRIDPGLPASLLPADWQGRRAWEIFSSLNERWSPAAQEYVDRVRGGL